MRFSRPSAFIAALAIAGHVVAAPTELPGLSGLYSDTFRTDIYIQVAAEIQAIGQEQGLRRLHAMAQEPVWNSRVVILCRMLFSQRTGTNFRAPLLGAPVYMGGTNDADWPRAPIEVINGVPFLITTGYFLAGVAESAESYLRYSESVADWSDVHYTNKTLKEKQDALEVLLATTRWKTWSDSNARREFLTRQIK
jgi:hypothetical protein